MNKRKLKPGYYKVQKADYSSPYGAKHQRPNTNTIRILRVALVNNQLTYYLDLDQKGFEPSNPIMDDLEILSQYQSTPALRTREIVLICHDASGTEFKMNFGSVSDFEKARLKVEHLKTIP